MRSLRYGIGCYGVGLRVATAAAVGLAAVAAAAPVCAQSAADKATARQLATNGINLYREGKYAEALDKLQRAQALYDVPVHLLYIARAQVKLDRLVEGTETYRKLIRYPLQASAPAVFHEAVADAKKELPEYEPLVPSLNVVVDPAGIEGLSMSIDGEAVSAAVVGVDRPINPGQHTVRVEAPGYDPNEVSVDVAKSEKKAITVPLTPNPDAPVVAPPPEDGIPEPAPPGADDPNAGAEPAGPRGDFGFVVGLRLSGIVPSGSLRGETDGSGVPTGDDVPMTDFFGIGGGAEFHAGFRFYKYFTGKLFVEGYNHRPGPALDDLSGVMGNVTVTNTTTSSGFGIGAMVGTPRGQFGGFGELGFVISQTFTADQDANIEGVSCEFTDSYSGSAFRIGGGGIIPVGRMVHLVPSLMFTIGTVSDRKLEGDCPGVPDTQFSQEDDIPDDLQRTHSQIVFSVGGDFMFGPD